MTLVTALPLTEKRNIRHSLDADRVTQQVQEKIADHERFRVMLKARAEETLRSYEAAKLDGSALRWTTVPDGGLHIDAMVDAMVAHEANVYALVRVVELPQQGKRFLLVYGDVDDSTGTRGTGPFESIAAAEAWFFSKGR